MQVGILVYMLVIYAVVLLTTVLTVICIQVESQTRKRHAWVQTQQNVPPIFVVDPSQEVAMVRRLSDISV